MKTTLAVILAMFISNCIFAAADPASSPASGTPGNRDQLIDQLLTVSGMKRSLQMLPAQIAPGIMQSALESGASTDEKLDLAKSLEQAFPKDVFVNRVTAALKKNYNEQRYASFLKLLSTSLATRMTELETQEPIPADVQAFLAQISKQQLPPERIRLIQRMDEAIHSSALLTTMTMSLLEARALAAGDDCSTTATKTRKAIEEGRPIIEKANQSSALVMLAFGYRNVPDADLDAYVKVFEDKDSRWVLGITHAAIEEQLKSSMAKGVQGLRKIVRAHKRKKTMFAPTCGQSESPEENGPHQDEPALEQKVDGERLSKVPAQRAAIPASKTVSADKLPKAERQANRQPGMEATPSDSNKAKVLAPAGKVRHYRVRGRDLRYCLSHATSAEIIACTEK